MFYTVFNLNVATIIVTFIELWKLHTVVMLKRSLKLTVFTVLSREFKLREQLILI